MARNSKPKSGITEKLNSLKAAIYIRVSTQYQIDKDSLQVQKRDLVAYAQMVLGIDDYVIFEDPGYSAKNTDRPDYQRMMSRLRSGEFSHLLVWKIDRISRNLLDFSSMYKELKDLGITFVSKNEQFDTSNAIGEAMLKIILVFAELERNMTSERVTAVMLSRAENGQWNGGRVPYGYDWSKKEKLFSVNANEAKVVTLIYSLYEQYQSVLYVTRYLNDAGLKTKAGKAWSTTGVYKILTNPFYKGAYLYNVHSDGKAVEKRGEGEWITVERHHEPIISDILFDRIQFVLKRNKRGGVPEDKTYIKKNIHVFAGLVKCGVCGNAMTATLDKRRADGWRPSIYGCSKRRNDASACNNKYCSDTLIGPFVFNYIANIIRAKETTSKRTTLDTLERKLLRGDVFSIVEHIDPEALKRIYQLLIGGHTGVEYKPQSVYNKGSATVDEISMLQERRRKSEKALHRLQALYFYGDEELPEKDYIVTKKKMTDDLKEIDNRLAELHAIGGENCNDESEEFIRKASYFVMVENLLDERYVDYEKYIRSIDPSIARNFIVSVVQTIEVEDGRVKSITFKNGITHTFIYKSKA